jgi:hypothetical protein
MNQIELIKRAWRITWRYRVLWIFGILLAFTAGGSGGGGGGGRSGTNFANIPSLGRVPGLANVNWAVIWTIVALCCCLLLLAVILATVVRLVARASLYRMVDRIEEAGAAPAWREGFRLGWSSRTFRLFLLDLVVGIPVVVAVILMIAIAAAPVIVLANTSLRPLGIVLTALFGLGFLLLGLLGAAVLSLLNQFWAREVVLGDRSVGGALVGGYALARRALKDVAILWLLTFVIGLAFALVLLAVVIALLVAGAAVGAAAGFGLYAITRSIALGILAGLPLFLLILIVPIGVIKGIYLTWESSTWTLAYRDVVGRLAAAPVTDQEPV